MKQSFALPDIDRVSCKSNGIGAYIQIPIEDPYAALDFASIFR
jgi:hypothetical protein